MPTLYTTNEEVAHHRCHLLIYYTDFRETTLDVLKTKRRPFSTNSELISFKCRFVLSLKDRHKKREHNPTTQCRLSYVPSVIVRTELLQQV